MPEIFGLSEWNAPWVVANLVTPTPHPLATLTTPMHAPNIAYAAATFLKGVRI